ncbi:MAG: hypothetical protein K8T25_03970 [Planctomycetia bacterium]|nr:hypothetical protein [Planctomycetia bacterium]
MIHLASQFATPFHRRLATDQWLQKLRSFLEDTLVSHQEYQTADAIGSVRAAFNEDRFTGPLSLVKYDFVVELEVARLGTTLCKDQYNASLRYSPDSDTFAFKIETISTVETRAAERKKFAKVDKLVHTIESGGSRDVVDRFACPWCGGKVDVNFHPSGTVFAVYCETDGMHFSKHVEISTPPSWWRDKVSENWLDGGCC